jgi:hypothetical protein
MLRHLSISCLSRLKEILKYIGQCSQFCGLKIERGTQWPMSTAGHFGAMYAIRRHISEENSLRRSLLQLLRKCLIFFERNSCAKMQTVNISKFVYITLNGV